MIYIYITSQCYSHYKMEHIDETTYVHDVYSNIAVHFDSTRYSPWKNVSRFIKELPANSTFLDIGCGNGKYFSIRDDLRMYGCDYCDTFVNIVKNRYKHVSIVKANGLNLPYNDCIFDYTISIAVLHHLTTNEKRIAFLNELVRVMKHGGKSFITVWSINTIDNRKSKWKFITKNDVLIPWNDLYSNKYERYYHLFDEFEFRDLLSNVKNIKINSVNLDNGNIHCIIEKETL